MYGIFTYTFTHITNIGRPNWRHLQAIKFQESFSQLHKRVQQLVLQYHQWHYND